MRYGFVTSKVFLDLGFKFSSVLTVTNPELQLLPKATNLSDGTGAHLSGLNINKNGPVYWIGDDHKLHGYPSLDVYNSWNKDNVFSDNVPANSADMDLLMGEPLGPRNLQ